MMQLRKDIKDLLHQGIVIPAHPLALDSHRKLDVFHQKLLTKYYLASGAGGVAVGVHTTQFAIRDPQFSLYEKVLGLAAEVVKREDLNRPFIKVAGVSGPTNQAIDEAEIARNLGYEIVLLSMNGLSDWSEEMLLERARKVGETMPLFGFYLQPAVGGKVLSEDFWKNFAEIPSVCAIKMAPFNRYQTLDVVRAVCSSKRNEDIALYTGNDDNILNDLLTTYQIETAGGIVEKDIVGGLLGHWAVWTHKAVQLLDNVKQLKKSNSFSRELLLQNIRITDSNAAFFDAKNNFKGCIAGLHEVLRRQGLMEGIWCLDPEEALSPGQMAEIDRVYKEYPELNDDEFVKANLEKWKAEISG
ncbi:MAG: dihydrodipicolinate synthase family protein [Bacteroidota bacterium]